MRKQFKLLIILVVIVGVGIGGYFTYKGFNLTTKEVEERVKGKKGAIENKATLPATAGDFSIDNNINISCWKMFGGNPKHSFSLGINEAILAPSDSSNLTETLDYLWKVKIDITNISEVILSDDHLYIASVNGRLLSINIKNGTVEFDINDLANNILSIASYDGFLYIDCGEKIICFSPKEKRIIWSINVRKKGFSTFAIYPKLAIDDGILIVPLSEDGLVAIDTIKRKLLWKFNNIEAYHSPTIYEKAVYVMLEDDVSGILEAIDLITGKEKWKKRFPFASSHISPALSRDDLFFISEEGIVYAFDIETGSEKWEKVLLDYFQENNNCIDYLSPAISNNSIIISYGELAPAKEDPVSFLDVIHAGTIALNQEKGKKIWNLYETEGLLSFREPVLHPYSPAISENLIYFGKAIFDLQTGGLRVFDIVLARKLPSLSNIILKNNVAYSYDRNGNISAFRIKKMKKSKAYKELSKKQEIISVREATPKAIVVERFRKPSESEAELKREELNFIKLPYIIVENNGQIFINQVEKKLNEVCNYLIINSKKYKKPAIILLFSKNIWKGKLERKAFIHLLLREIRKAGIKEICIPSKKALDHWNRLGFKKDDKYITRYEGERALIFKNILFVGFQEISAFIITNKGLLNEPKGLYVPDFNFDENELSKKIAELLKPEEEEIKATFRVGGLVSKPKLIKRVAPDYPEKAKKQGIEGTVILEIIIDENGNVTDARILRSPGKHFGFNDAALKAIKQWKYEPALMDGNPVKVIYTEFIKFSLKENY